MARLRKEIGNPRTASMEEVNRLRQLLNELRQLDVAAGRMTTEQAEKAAADDKIALLRAEQNALRHERNQPRTAKGPDPRIRSADGAIGHANTNTSGTAASAAPGVPNSGVKSSSEPGSRPMTAIRSGDAAINRLSGDGMGAPVLGSPVSSSGGLQPPDGNRPRLPQPCPVAGAYRQPSPWRQASPCSSGYNLTQSGGKPVPRTASSETLRLNTLPKER